MMCRVSFLVNLSSCAAKCTVSRLVLLTVIFSIRSGQAIDAIDQPKLFVSHYEWNQNAFKRVADCIRDSAPLSSDTYYRRQIKNWAAPLCNDLLRKLNNNWQYTGFTNGVNAVQPVNADAALSTLLDVEYNWNRIAYGLYGLITRQQNCGINGAFTICVYVLNSDLKAITATQSEIISGASADNDEINQINDLNGQISQIYPQ